MLHTLPIAALWLTSLVAPGVTCWPSLTNGLLARGGVSHVVVVEDEDAGRLAVTVSSLRSDEGRVRLLLFAGSAGFPDEPARAVKRVSLPIKGRTARVVFDGLAPGEYAISVIHDENDNEALDTGLFGIPSEGFGASNNPKIRRGPPRFSEAAFRVEADGVAVQMIRVRYF